MSAAPVRALVAAVTFCIAVQAGAELAGAGTLSPPAVRSSGAGGVVVYSLPPLLEDPEVQRHLTSGLTTSLVVTARAPGTRSEGGARVDVRFEPWDEVFFATVLDAGGAVPAVELESVEALAAWWAGLELELAVAGLGAGESARARILLAVVPFSQAELVDAQRWLVESVGEVSRSPGTEGERAAGGAIEALIATSIRRRAVRTWSWELPVEGRAAP